ncbi:helix-turn-helix domain-containing protein [Desulfurivibrio alkaliphilus]|uniref:HTH cro/C1-type domain-containing protein n=1 Tax=Desulfurivibrio alkaliphilus (strain DSM 19089 / UNIQEM U267 / AHT2) TaxID=589865 RepID=D6Z382_DESAT|nr:helix-turn-helix domain-containing protein [Desulfurivibrio alkaliphilus]ADH86007.1 conserved hypothetical protein [Desulfurivibrio alkaliphilus AHT 2]
MSSEQTGQHTAEEQMEEGLALGEKLRRARTAKGISLEEAAGATRIHTSTLRALEENNRAALPASTFTRGFVRIYANHLGLDQEAALRQHIKESGLPEAATTEKVNIHEILAGERMAEPLRALSGSRFFWVMALLVAVLAVYWGYNSYFRPIAQPTAFPLESVFDQAQPEATPSSPATQATASTPEPLPAPPEQPAVATQPPPAAPAPLTAARPPADRQPAPAGAESTPQPEAPALSQAPVPSHPANAEASHVLEARFVEDTWVRLQIDQEPARQLFFQPGESRTWKAVEQLELRIGNAGGVELSYNGEPLPPLGRSGQVTDLSFP